jgi:hypothetical protein
LIFLWKNEKEIKKELRAGQSEEQSDRPTHLDVFCFCLPLTLPIPSNSKTMNDKTIVATGTKQI